MKTWTRIKWPYNNAAPYCDWECWKLDKVILYPGLSPTEGWSYVRTGATSEHAHSGFLEGYVTLASAQARVEELIRQGQIVN